MDDKCDVFSVLLMHHINPTDRFNVGKLAQVKDEDENLTHSKNTGLHISCNATINTISETFNAR